LSAFIHTREVGGEMSWHDPVSDKQSTGMNWEEACMSKTQIYMYVCMHIQMCIDECMVDMLALCIFCVPR
jgi:ferredoxin